MRIYHGVATAVTFAVLLASSAACSASSQPEILGEAAEALPHSSLQDWATYADHLVTLNATAESKTPLTAAEQQRGEGYSARIVTLRVADNLWTRQGSTKPLPATIDLANGGWMVNGNESREVGFEGITKADVGKSYVAVITFSDITAVVDPQTRKVAAGEGAAWTVLDLAELSPEGIISNQGFDPMEHPALRSIANLTGTAAAALVATASPDPAAARYMTLDPVVRYQYVNIDRVAADPMTPGPGES